MIRAFHVFVFKTRIFTLFQLNAKTRKHAIHGQSPHRWRVIHSQLCGQRCINSDHITGMNTSMTYTCRKVNLRDYIHARVHKESHNMRMLWGCATIRMNIINASRTNTCMNWCWKKTRISSRIAWTCAVRFKCAVASRDNVHHDLLSIHDAICMNTCIAHACCECMHHNWHEAKVQLIWALCSNICITYACRVEASRDSLEQLK